MILIQLLPCLSKVPDQFFSFLLRKQCNGTIVSSPELTIVGHPALGNWLTLCKHFITTLLLVYISQNILFSLAVVASHMFIHLSFSHWISSTVSH